MSTRHRTALQHHENTPSITDLCNGIAAAQREMYDAKLGTDAVRDDPAVRLMATHLARRFDVAALDHSPSSYVAASEECERQAAKGSRSHRDGLDAQSGASNPSGLALSLARYCAEDGMQAPEQHAGLRLIAHQLAFLCNVQNVSDQELDGMVGACRARRAMDELADHCFAPTKAAAAP